ncbi:MAG: hypothetical protein M0Q14_08755 [Tissierellaceae bacterium]|nr:hypothetical protein [Tissierellaceae bacterium]
MTTMKMGMIIAKGTELEMKKEFDVLKKKAREGFKEEIREGLNEFQIIKTDIKISFKYDKLFSEFAIFQIIN